MKILPLKDYRTPRYPTLTDSLLEPGLLNRLPRRWSHSAHLSTVLGLGLLTEPLLAEGGDPATATALVPSPAKPANAPNVDEASRQVQRATTLIAPILADALEYDGRGTFGCVAVAPPTFLSEDEALELIRTELEAAGLKLAEDVPLANVPAPVPAGSEELGTAAVDLGVDNMLKDRDWDLRTPPRLAAGDYEFGLADTNRAVYVEYLSLEDYDAWMGGSMSSVSSYDMSKLTHRITEAWRKREAGPKAVVGLFFDPLSSDDRPMVDRSGLNEKQQRLVTNELRERNRKGRDLDATAREKLRRQVQHFIAFLREQGVVGTH
jgi:hypothetical protein